MPVDTLRERLLHHRGVDYKNFDEVVVNEPYGPGRPCERFAGRVDRAPLGIVERNAPASTSRCSRFATIRTAKWASHIFGYVGAITEEEYKTLAHEGYSPNDVVGKDGLEYQYDRYLRGVPGGERVMVNSSGAVVASVASQSPIAGDTLVTNLDWRLQEIVESALSDGIQRWGHGRRLSGAVVAEDPWTGGILALASYPNFDPRAFAGEKSKLVRRYLIDPSEPLFDRAIAAATPTGFDLQDGHRIRGAHRRGRQERPGGVRHRRLELRRLLRARYRLGWNGQRTTFVPGAGGIQRWLFLSLGVVAGQRTIAQICIGVWTRCQERRRHSGVRAKVTGRPMHGS